MSAPDQQSPSPRTVNLILPGAILALLALAGYVAFVPALQTNRPSPSEASLPAPPSVDGMIPGYARLWEDPLEAAYRVSVTDQHDDDWDQVRLQVRKSLAALARNSQGTTGTAAAATRKGLHVMTVLLPGEPHAESTETRRRIRYAVTSALGVAGYHLAFPDRITFVQVPLQVKIKAVDGQAEAKLRVPIKLYRITQEGNQGATSKPSSVLVLWLNESRLGAAPLAATTKLLDELFGGGVLEQRHRAAIDFSLIGPTSSDTLLTMAKESVSPSTSIASSESPEAGDDSQTGGSADQARPERDGRWPLQNMTIYSYRATIGSEELGDQTTLKRFLGYDQTPARPRVVRMIGTDRQLVTEIFQELKLRNALPRRDGDDSRHVVILTERDTSYGRGLRDLFRYHEATTERAEFGLHRSNLHLFTYLRGIDGQTVGGKAPEQADRPALHDSTSSFETELPNGGSQYDYIRRVAQQVVKLQARLRHTGQGEISAVGVMGTDVYDKLLIMRALRPRLPNAIYFTTDLDAAMSHASEYATTRNLIVASHFGRELHPFLQREAPVFRDSYQTSCFLATLVAVGDEVTSELFVDKDSRNDPWRLEKRLRGADSRKFLSPLMFEISRTGPHNLSSISGPRENEKWYEELRNKAVRTLPLAAIVHPPSNRDSVDALSSRGLFFGLVSLAFIFVCLAANVGPVRSLLERTWCAFQQLRRRQVAISQRLLLLAIVLTAILVVVIVVDSHRQHGEPFALASGISVWPTVILRFAAAALACYFVRKAVHDVRYRQQVVHREFHLEPQAATGSAISQMFSPRSWRDLLADQIYVDTAGEDEPVQDKWQRFTLRTHSTSIIARIIPQVTLFCLFAYCLAPLGDPRSQPARGVIAFVVDEISFLAGLLGIIIVTFVVLDLAQCCRYFAKSLRKSTKTAWPSPYLSSHGAAHLTPPELIGYRAKIDLIASVSKTYSRLIMYPSVVLVMLVFSHLSVFDNWTLPWPLAVLLLLCISAAIYGHFSLRNEVNKLRETVLRSVQDDRFAATQQSSRESLQQYQQAIEEITAERGGAFRPLVEDPLVQAISLPFGGLGGVVLLEQLLLSVG